MLRKAMISAVAMTVVLALGACGDSSDEGTATGPGSGTTAKVQGTIDFWMVDDAANAPEWWASMIKEFEAKNPGAHVKMTGFANTQLVEKTVAAFAAGNEPDVFYTNGGNELFKYSRRGLAESLDGQVDFEPYREEIIDAFLRDEGKAYGVPLLIGAPFALWYDAAFFKQNDLTAPTTWDQLLTFCDQANAKGIAPFALGNADLWPALLWFDALTYQYGGTSASLDATFERNGLDWTSPPFAQSVERLQELVRRECFQKNLNGTSYDKQGSLFFNHKAAMMLIGDWAPTDAKAKAPRGFDLDYAFMPDAPGAEFSTADGSGMGAAVPALSMSARSDDKDLAAAFLDFFGTQVNGFSKATQRQSPAVTAPEPATPLAKRMQRDTRAAKEFYGVSDIILPSTLYDDIYQNVQKVTLGQLDGQGFGDAMNEAVKRESSNLNK